MSGASKDRALRLLQMPLSQDTDVVLCRNRARVVAEGLRFDKQQQVKIATAVSEIARNAFRYARRAKAAFQLLNHPPGSPAAQSLIITVSDDGPGIGNLDEVLAGTYRSKTGMGAGIRGAKRLMDRVDIATSPDGTSVDLWQALPKDSVVSAAEIQQVVGQLVKAGPENPLEELATQNRELVSTLEEISAQRVALEQMNEELSETNRGVVALYDELDTVHRVGRVVAAKLDLDSLLRAITDATTELSNSEFGAFLPVGPGGNRLIWQCVSGTLVDGFPECSPPPVADIILDDSSDIFRFEEGDCPKPLSEVLNLRSMLVCPLRDDERTLIGVLILGHTSPQIYTERTERILPTVALQASIGIANAKLYRHVQTANQAKAQFLAVLSHELRTPLNPVFAILTSLEENPHLPEEARRDLVVMRRNLQLEATLIDDLLDLTRISEGKMTLKLATHDIDTIVRSVVHTCNAEIERKHTTITVELKAKEHHVVGDEVRLQQALWNLVNNAVKFTPENGSIQLRTVNDEQGNIIISVTDSGKGIEAEALERVFTAFEQEDALVAARFGGLGLGLAISKGIVDAHQGRISAESRGAGRGATFSISLPTTVPPAAPAVAPLVLASVPEPTHLRILMVDDHDDTRMVMCRMLKARGYVMTEAGSVAEALAKFKVGEFDLVISDLGLPDGSGHELMEEILKIRPVTGIALSGYGMETDLARSQAAGFAKHLTKPVDFQALDSAIAKLSSRD
jgi:signal transduction histidine kinase/CheY-like chemotaxis protein